MIMRDENSGCEVLVKLELSSRGGMTALTSLFTRVVPRAMEESKKVNDLKPGHTVAD